MNETFLWVHKGTLGEINRVRHIGDEDPVSSDDFMIATEAEAAKQTHIPLSHWHKFALCGDNIIRLEDLVIKKLP